MLKQKKNIKRHRYLFKKSKTFLNPIVSTFNTSINKSIIIRVTQNNVFCTLINLINKNTLFLTSSGKEKTSITKKTLKFNSKRILISFLKKINKIIKKDSIAIDILAPLIVKKIFINIFKTNFKKNFIFINTQSKKAFNGCKSTKKKRKKQRKGLRIYS